MNINTQEVVGYMTTCDYPKIDIETQLYLPLNAFREALAVRQAPIEALQELGYKDGDVLFMTVFDFDYMPSFLMSIKFNGYMGYILDEQRNNIYLIGGVSVDDGLLYSLSDENQIIMPTNEIIFNDKMGNQIKIKLCQED